jgi:hypothetical protein
MFQLTLEEVGALRSQIVTLEKEVALRESKKGKHSKYPSYVFTENGVAMLSSVLRSKYAIKVNIQIIRAFTRLRQLISSHKALARKIEVLEKKYDKHEIELSSVFKLLKKLMEPPADKPAKKIGFLP